ncbi:MAG: response regulator [Desulfobacterales bacterium]|nr:response regulator [Desulfobacterales bacterium]
MSYRIIVADDEPISRMDITEILEDAGYQVLGEASDGFDAVEMCRKHNPDLILMDIKMPLLDGLKAARMIRQEKLAKAVLLLTAYSGKQFVDQAKEIGVAGYLVKPVSEASLLPMIEIAVSQAGEITRMEGDIARAQEQLESRKLIEKAKGILMKQDGISENEAFKRIRKLSMDKQCPMKDIAKIIILNN